MFDNATIRYFVLAWISLGPASALAQSPTSPGMPHCPSNNTYCSPLDFYRGSGTPSQGEDGICASSGEACTPKSIPIVPLNPCDDGWSLVTVYGILLCAREFRVPKWGNVP